MNKTMIHPSCLALFGLILSMSLAGPLRAQGTTPEPPKIERARVEILPHQPGAHFIRITADRDDCTYPLGATPLFRIQLAADPYPAGGIPITYRLGPESFEGAGKAAVVPAEGLALPVDARGEPGFVRLMVEAVFDGQTNTATGTVGFAPELIQPTQTEPEDFDAFWAKQREDLAAVPMDLVLEPLPGRSTPEVEVFHWSVQNVGNWEGPSRFYGVLAVPQGPGPFPAVLHVPGAGVRPYAGQVSQAAKGIITLEVGIHGIPVDRDEALYKALSRGALNNYPTTALHDRHAYFYRRVVLGCLRANDYLASHPKWDGSNLVVMGFSQGGMLSIITAALDARVTALAAAYPAYCDVTGYLHGRAGGWPAFFRPDRDGNLQSLAPGDPRLVTTTYYDVVNFARRVRVPGHYSLGYNDPVCPPTSMFAACNLIAAPREFVVAPGQGHRVSAVQHQRREAWLGARLGLP